MNLADLSIRRPTFITCVVIIMLAVGWLSMQKLGVDLFPDVTFPVVTVRVPYPGAGPEEIETLVTRPLEDEISTLSGMKRLSSVNMESMSMVIAEFSLETDVKAAEQQIRDRVSSAKAKMPIDIKEPIIRRIDPADQPVLTFALDAKLSPAELFDLADNEIKTKIQQVSKVGVVDVLGGRKREIQVLLDRTKLKNRELSASGVAMRLAGTGENIPVGSIEEGEKETVYRTIGQFASLKDIEKSLVSFYGSDVPTTVADIGRVVDTLADETSRTYVNSDRSILINVFKQSGSNTIAVVDGVKARVNALNAEIAKLPGAPKLTLIRDSSVWIHANVDDVKESILMGIVLAMAVVFLFLANPRSTIITGLALPNSLIGAFILMSFAGFSINIMTLLALSLAVGLLIDDAIVVRENIFRHIELGADPETAARVGTAEVNLAVIATTATVIAVFGPVGFLKGVVGQFFKQFGLTICFAMAISLFDALTIAPMLSTYFAGDPHAKGGRFWNLTFGPVLKSFDRFQTGMENAYGRVLGFTIRRPLLTLFLSFVVFVVSTAAVTKVPKTFLPTQDAGEFAVGLELPAGSALDAMDKVAHEVDSVIRANREVKVSSLTVNKGNGAPTADFYVRLIPAKERDLSTSGFKAKLREQLKPFARVNPTVKDYDAVGGGLRPFTVNIIGNDQAEIERIGAAAMVKIKEMKSLIDPDFSVKPGKPEFQVAVDDRRANLLGASSRSIGGELRTMVEGNVAAKFREKGREYDVRVRVEPDQRNIKSSFNSIYVPNLNQQLIRLSDVATTKETTSALNIRRIDRGRYVQITADIAPGAGLSDILNEVSRILEKDVGLPPGVRFAFIGQAENFKELGESMVTAMGLGMLFIFLVLASLYESFVTPFTIMLALPLALCGSFVALWIAKESLNIFSMIGIIMLLGVAVKNSILLVDYANQLIREGKSRGEALIQAGKTRLRPILMTTMALIAGTMPIALGLNEASRQRTSMGVAIIGGLISSTVLTLLVVPAAFSYIDRFRLWSKGIMKRNFGSSLTQQHPGNGSSDSQKRHSQQSLSA